jgi:HD-like signal output (HDOD) protein
MDHAEAGGVLLEHWRFPEPLVEAVRRHHEPGAQASLPTALVHAADVLCFQGGLGCACAQGAWAMAPEIESRWPMDEARRLRILEGAKRDFEEMKRIFAAK